MDFQNILPVSYLSEFFNIPIDILLITIILTGFFTVRITQKNQALKKIPTIDTIFLMAMTGLTWFIRIALILFWIYQLIIHQESIKEFEGFPIIYVYIIIIYTLASSSLDINAMRNKRLFNKKFKNIYLEKHRYEIVIIMALGVAIFLSLGVFITIITQAVEYIWFAFLYLFLMIFCISPMISIFIIALKKLHESPYIPIGRMRVLQ